MRELSLFTGAGGGLLGTKLLGWEHIGYVEINDYCQRVIRQRIDDGILDDAPIFSDIRAFISEGYAASYQGLVDVLSAGFPCQPFTVQGKRLGEDDERNKWPETAETVRIVQPLSVLLENVPGLISSGYFPVIIGNLANMGYVGRWGVIRGVELGSPQFRARLFIVAHHNDAGQPYIQRWQAFGEQYRESPVGACDWRKIGMAGGEDTSEFWRIPYGLGDGMDRLKALGNGQIPAVVRAAWSLLNV